MAGMWQGQGRDMSDLVHHPDIFGAGLFQFYICSALVCFSPVLARPWLVSVEHSSKLSPKCVYYFFIDFFWIAF
jgi:hypothetical protein